MILTALECWVLLASLEKGTASTQIGRAIWLGASSLRSFPPEIEAFEWVAPKVPQFIRTAQSQAMPLSEHFALLLTRVHVTTNKR